MHAGQTRRQAPLLERDVNAMLDTARDALAEVRRSIWNLQPGALDGRSLPQALEAELRALQRAGIEGSLEVRGTFAELSAGIEAAALRIAQEALANVRKHSGAAYVVVTLEYEPGALALRVDDDGRGPQPSAGRTLEGGYGITSMRERARLLGGELTIGARPGGGTTLQCVLPLAEPPLRAPAPPSPRRRPRADAVRVVIADDHTLVREGVRRLLAEADDVAIVGEALNGADALEVVAREHPDVLLLDIQMPSLGGLGVLERLRESNATTRVIVLTTFAQDETVFQAVRLGARGYLLKDATASELLNAIRVVAAGGSLLTPEAAGRLAERVQRQDALTGREREVLALVAEGLRNKEIAARLGASEKTVQFHIANIFGKFGAQSRTEAVRIANERGLLTP
jgi:DNA-binding NarL/FixJ family response regulator/two-component sensor histidine kinase